MVFARRITYRLVEGREEHRLLCSILDRGAPRFLTISRWEATRGPAAALNNDAQLSVWDETFTTSAQAQAFLAPNHRLPLWLSVEAIRQILESKETQQTLRVFREPEPRRLPGADGHCSIENVWPSKSDFRRIRADLVTIAKADRGEIA